MRILNAKKEFEFRKYPFEEFTNSLNVYYNIAFIHIIASFLRYYFQRHYSTHGYAYR